MSCVLRREGSEGVAEERQGLNQLQSPARAEGDLRVPQRGRGRAGAAGDWRSS